MARKKRVWIAHEWYHIVCRGNRRDPLFKSEVDFQVFLQILELAHERFGYHLYSYCLMTNHFHLQMKSPYHSISKVMAFINKKYANYYNHRYRLTGHVFEKRFFSKIIIGEQVMHEVRDYIHNNPVKAGMTACPEDYLWSSSRYYGGRGDFSLYSKILG